MQGQILTIDSPKHSVSEKLPVGNHAGDQGHCFGALRLRTSEFQFAEYYGIPMALRLTGRAALQG